MPPDIDYCNPYSFIKYIFFDASLRLVITEIRGRIYNSAQFKSGLTNGNGRMVEKGNETDNEKITKLKPRISGINL